MSPCTTILSLNRGSTRALRSIGSNAHNTIMGRKTASHMVIVDLRIGGDVEWPRRMWL